MMKYPPKNSSLNYFAIPGMMSVELVNLLYVVSRHTNVDPTVIRSKDQTRDVATARHIFSYVARRKYGFTFKYIARFLNRSSHSTIKKSSQQAENYLETDKQFRKLYESVWEAVEIEENRQQSMRREQMMKVA